MQKNSGTILGLGNDIIEIERIRLSIQNHGQHFLDRLFTPNEQKYCFEHQDPAPRYAGRFAGKEAIVKALGVGFGEHANWLDIEILANKEGKPIVHFSDKLMHHFDRPKILLSISHCKEYATAVAIWVQDSLNLSSNSLN